MMRNLFLLGESESSLDCCVCPSLRILLLPPSSNSDSASEYVSMCMEHGLGWKKLKRLKSELVGWGWEPQDTDALQVVTSVPGGISSSAISPDESILALVSQDHGSLFIFETYCWSKPLIKVDLGRGSSPFRDSTTPQSSSLANDKSHISWRSDGQFVAISFCLDQLQTIHVYNREGVFFSRLEHFPGVISGGIAWRPTGCSTIAIPLSLPDKLCVALIEKNGLKRADVQLNIKTNNISTTKIMDIQWNSAGSILSLSLLVDSHEQIICLLMPSNHSWLTKFVRRFNVNIPYQMNWDSFDPLNLSLSSSSSFIDFKFVMRSSFSNCRLKNDNGNLAIIDGSTLNVTPFRKMKVPPPYSAYVIELDDVVRDICFDSSVVPWIKCNKFPEYCPIIELMDDQILLGLSETNRLYANSHEIASNVNSFILISDFLLITTNTHRLKILKVDNLFIKDSEYVRSLERGSRIVIAFESTLVLQMPHSALKLICKLRANGNCKIAEECLTHLCLYVDSNELFNVALGSYNLEFALYIASKVTSKDPKEYDFKGALSHASQKDFPISEEYVSDLVNMVASQRLYSYAMKILSIKNELFIPISEEYGNYLFAKRYYEDAALLFELSGNKEKSLNSWKRCGKWRNVLCHDLENSEQTCLKAISAYLQGGHWQEAYELIVRLKRNDLLEINFLPTLIRSSEKNITTESNDLDEDAFSEGSRVQSTICSTSQSLTTVKTLESLKSKSTKARRKIKKKLFSSKKGSEFEDIGLVIELHSLISNVYSYRSEIHELLSALVRMHQLPLACKIQKEFKNLIELVGSSVDKIWLKKPLEFSSFETSKKNGSTTSFF
ncbi:ELP1 [Lepeophtheirus salmonis]|uniref:ELP1 n=1 Tax=Lepeophtheirus salmonis TaxID=72036 RepID=A0A7R8CYW6_LEPSM|nr:ELP1 [Lepeophtheirus salmonis]CAF2972049.1 ELP1 [Lepeophtheirus salmonis]